MHLPIFCQSCSVCKKCYKWLDFQNNSLLLISGLNTKRFQDLSVRPIEQIQCISCRVSPVHQTALSVNPEKAVLFCATAESFSLICILHFSFVQRNMLRWGFCKCVLPVSWELCQNHSAEEVEKSNLGFTQGLSELLVLCISVRQAAGQQKGGRQITWFLLLLVRSDFLAKATLKVRL